MASHGVPVGFTSTGSGTASAEAPGGAMIVVEPFSKTVTPSSPAARRACSSRRASTLAASVPSSRASSPACGVISVGADRGSRPLT